MTMEIEIAIEQDASGGLYDTDFYAWTQHQAALLEKGDLQRADVTNIREEIEALGRKEVAELRSRLRILSAHLLKETYQSEKSSRSWATTILNQRIELEDHMDDNPSLKSKLSEAFAKAYASARELASTETGLPLKTFPVEAPFTCEEAMSKSWAPKPASVDEGE